MIHFFPSWNFSPAAWQRPLKDPVERLATIKEWSMPLQDCWSDRQLTVETRRSPTRRTLNNRHSGSLLCNLIWLQSLLDKVMLQVSNKIPQKWQCTFNRLWGPCNAAWYSSRRIPKTVFWVQAEPKHISIPKRSFGKGNYWSVCRSFMVWTEKIAGSWHQTLELFEDGRVNHSMSPLKAIIAITIS